MSASGDGARAGGFMPLLGVAVLAAMMEGYDIQSIAIAAPLIAPEMRLDARHIGQVFSIGQAGLVVGALAGGPLSDRWRRRDALAAGLACFGLFSLLTARVEVFATLAAARFATGIGIGLALPNLLNLVTERAPAAHRAKAVAVTLAGMSLGAVAVALIGARFIDAIGWRSLFTIGGVLPLLIVPAVLTLSDAAPRGAARPARGRWREALFGTRLATTLLLWAALFLTAATLYMMINWLPSLMRARGFALAIAHGASAAFSLGSCVGSIGIGVLVDRHGYARVLPPAYLGVLAGVAVVLRASSPEAVILGAAVLGLFVSGAFYTLNGLAARCYPAETRGTSTGAAVAIGRIGSIGGPLIGGYALQFGIGVVAPGPSAVPLAALPLVALAGAATVALTRRVRVDPAEPVIAQSARSRPTDDTGSSVQRLR